MILLENFFFFFNFQVLFDGNPHLKFMCEKEASKNNDFIRCRTFKINDFFSDTQIYRKAYQMESRIIDEDQKRREFVKELCELIKK